MLNSAFAVANADLQNKHRRYEDMNLHQSEVASYSQKRDLKGIMALHLQLPRGDYATPVTILFPRHKSAKKRGKGDACN